MMTGSTAVSLVAGLGLGDGAELPSFFFFLRRLIKEQVKNGYRLSQASPYIAGSLKMF